MTSIPAEYSLTLLRCFKVGTENFTAADRFGSVLRCNAKRLNSARFACVRPRISSEICLPLDCWEKVPGFRSRSFSLPVVFWTFLCQVLARGFLPTGRVLSAGASEPTWQGHLFAKHRSILQGVGSYSDLFDHQDSPASHLCYVPSSNGLPKTKFPTGHSDENPEPSNDDRSHISCSMFPDIK
jgi:hypothetical protein